MIEYKYEDIFEDIPGDPDNVLMNIPEEICKAADLKPGDTLNITIKDGYLCLTKVKN